MALNWVDIKNGDVTDASQINNVAHAVEDVEKQITELDIPVKTLGGTTVGGVDSLAGQRGYYIQSLDLVNHKFYISKTRVENPSLTEHSVDTAFQEEPFYQVGDRFSFISGNHYDFCGRITSINHNEITYEAGTVFIDSAGEEFSEFVDSPLDDDNTFFVPSKAEIGAVEIKNVGLAFGTRCISGGRDSFATGVDVIAGGDFSFATGNEVTTGYNDFGFGFDSHIHGYWNAGGGRQVNVDGRYSWGFGYETLVKAVAAGAFGQGTQALSDHQFVTGKYNEIDSDGKYARIVGNGTDKKSSNAYTLDWEGNGWFAGNVTVGKDKQLLATQEFVCEQADSANITAQEAKEMAEDLSQRMVTVDGNNRFTGENQFNRETVFLERIMPLAISALNTEFTIDASDKISFTTQGGDIFFTVKGSNDNHVTVSVAELLERISGLEARIAELEAKG